MRTRFTQAPGVSFRAISLPTGPMRGIEIDNPSGAWLYIPSLETFVPPYIVGWSYSFPYQVSAIDIIAGNGPAGQLGTAQGEAVVVYLTDEPTVTSEGSPTTGSVVKPLATSTVNQIEFRSEVELPVVIVSGAVGRIMRLYSFRIRNSNDPVVGLPDAEIAWSILYDPTPFPAPPQGTTFAFGYTIDGIDDASFVENPIDIPLYVDNPNGSQTAFDIALLVGATWRQNSFGNTIIGSVSYQYHLRYSVI